MSWVFDLYPRTDPFAGTLIQRLEPAAGGLQKAEYRGEANGAGVGIIGMRGDGTYGQLIDPAGLQYVKVRRADTLAVDGGFFLEKGDFAALTEQRTRYLEFSGAGPLSYLDREVMWRYTYETWGNDPEEGGVDIWQLHSQSAIYAGGDYLGAVLWRVLHEAMGYVNAPGYVARTPHEDDKLETAIPGVSLTFDGFEDSSGNAWTLPSGLFTAGVGDSVYKVVQRLMRAGLYVEMDPDTGAISAWEAASHRRSRTGGAFGADVVRFVGGVNIKSDASRAISAYMRRTAVLAYGQNMGSMATGAADVPWHGAVYSDAQEDAALEQLAASEIAHRADVGDVLKLRIKTGSDPLTGAYMPFEHILLDDVVTVHTGTTQWDHNDASYPVGAIELKLREAGDWDAYVHLGAVFMDASSRAFQVAPVAEHHHTIVSCCPDAPTPGTPGSPGTTVVAWEGDADGLDTSDQYPINTSGVWFESGVYRVYNLGTGGLHTVTPYAPAAASTAYVVVASVANEHGTTTDPMYLQISWRDSVGNIIRSDDFGPVAQGAGFTAFSEAVTSPAGTAHVSWFLYRPGHSHNWAAADYVRITTPGTAGTPGDTTEPVGGEGDPGESGTFSPIDHVHAHGTHPSGNLHPEYLTEAQHSELEHDTGGTHDHDADYEPLGTVATHEAAGNPHPDYATDADLAAHAADTGLHGGGGGGGAAWTQILNLALTSLTDWTSESGTWTAETDRIRQAATAATTYRLRYGGIILPARAVVEVEVRMAAGTAGGTWAGLSLGVANAGGTGGAGAFLRNNGTLTNELYFETEGITAHGQTTLPSTVAYNTWATLRAVLTDGSIDAYVNGAHVATGRNLLQPGTRPRFQLIARQADVSFRNLKVWSQAAALP